MRRPRFPGAVLAPAALAVLAASALADEPASRASVEVVVPGRSVRVGEVVTVRVRASFDAAWFRAHVVPTFRRAMDHPVHVQASWFDAVPRARRVADPPPVAGRSATFALNDAVVSAATTTVTRDGADWTVLEVARAFVPERAGDVVLDAATIRFAWSEEFADDLLQGRVPSDRREAVVPGAIVVLRVEDVPEDGRPEGFTGAVGTFTVRADASPAEADVGGTIRLRLVIDGEGNASGFAPPRLERLDGFHVVGMLDDRGSPRRTVVYEISPLGSDVRAVPPIEFVVFDPTPPGAYRTLRTEPIPLTVRGAPRAPRLPAVPEDAASGAAPDAAPSGASRFPVPIAVGVGVAVGLAVARTLRRRRAARAAAVAPATRSASDDFRDEVARRDGDVGAALTAFLAARLGCPPATVVSPGLAGRLVAAGVRRELAERAAEVVERTVAARYGGTPADDVATVALLVGEIAREDVTRA